MYGSRPTAVVTGSVGTRPCSQVRYSPKARAAAAAGAANRPRCDAGSTGSSSFANVVRRASMPSMVASASFANGCRASSRFVRACSNTRGAFASRATMASARAAVNGGGCSSRSKTGPSACWV